MHEWTAGLATEVAGTGLLGRKRRLDVGLVIDGDLELCRIESQGERRGSWRRRMIRHNLHAKFGEGSAEPIARLTRCVAAATASRRLVVSPVAALGKQASKKGTAAVCAVSLASVAPLADPHGPGAFRAPEESAAWHR